MERFLKTQNHCSEPALADQDIFPAASPGRNFIGRSKKFPIKAIGSNKVAFNHFSGIVTPIKGSRTKTLRFAPVSMLTAVLPPSVRAELYFAWMRSPSKLSPGRIARRLSGIPPYFLKEIFSGSFSPGLFPLPLQNRYRKERKNCFQNRYKASSCAFLRDFRIVQIIDRYFVRPTATFCILTFHYGISVRQHKKITLTSCEISVNSGVSAGARTRTEGVGGA